MYMLSYEYLDCQGVMPTMTSCQGPDDLARGSGYPVDDFLPWESGLVVWRWQETEKVLENHDAQLAGNDPNGANVKVFFPTYVD